MKATARAKQPEGSYFQSHRWSLRINAQFDLQDNQGIHGTEGPKAGSRPNAVPHRVSSWQPRSISQLVEFGGDGDGKERHLCWLKGHRCGETAKVSKYVRLVVMYLLSPQGVVL